MARRTLLTHARKIEKLTEEVVRIWAELEASGSPLSCGDLAPAHELVIRIERRLLELRTLMARQLP